MLQAYVSICFTLFQYVAASAAPHVLSLTGTHALHAPIQRCLSLSSGLAPIVVRAHNPNGQALPDQSACAYAECQRGQHPTESNNIKRRHGAQQHASIQTCVSVQTLAWPFL